MKIAIRRLIVASSLVLAAGCAHHDRQANYNEYSPTYGSTGTGAYSSPDSRSTFNTAASSQTTDSSLTSQVQQSIHNDTSLTSFASGIQVNAQNGTVTLIGNVPSEQDKQKIETMVKNTTGVVSVNNQLQVSLRPTSERQDQNSRIYHDSKDQGAATPNDSSLNRPPASASPAPESSKPQASTTDSTKSDLASADQTKTDSTKTDSSLNSATTAPAPATPSIDQSATSSQTVNPSTPTSERSTTRIYSDKQNDKTSAGAPTETLNLNVQGTTDSDRSLGRQVMQELRNDAALAGMLSQVKINVESGKLTLKGSVKSEEQKKNIETIAQKVTGVNTVDNQLTVGATDATGTEIK